MHWLVGGNTYISIPVRAAPTCVIDPHTREIFQFMPIDGWVLSQNSCFVILRIAPRLVCGWLAGILSQVANDDLCVNLQAAYDLSAAEYDEVSEVYKHLL